MGSNYFGNDQKGFSPSSSSSSSPSSRKGKKSNSDKPKQPQRGLGVAQLEKIRLHNQLGSNYLHTPFNTPNFNQEDMRMQTTYSSALSFSYSSPSPPPYGLHTDPSLMMGMPDFDRANIRYGDSQPTSVARWHSGNPALGSQHYVDPNMTRAFSEPGLEGSLNKENKKRRNDSMGSSSQNSECGSCQDIDLELRLSL